MNRIKIAIAALFLAALPLAGSAEDAPGVFKIPGTESTIKFYGYVQLDGTYDISGRIGDIENYDYASIVSVQPLDGTDGAEETGKLYLTARTSRFGIQTSTPTAMGNVGVRLEGDFNGPNGFQGQTYTNSVLFRLRHAYGTVGNLLVGQTWTNFLDFGGAPETVDFNGPGTLALVRQSQIRYTLPLMAGTSLAVSAEASRNGGVGHIPDFVARLSTSQSWGTAALALVTNQYRYAKAGESTPRSGTLQGFGGALSGSLKLGSAATVTAQVVAGQGLGRYLFNEAWLVGVGFQGVGTDGDPKLFTSTGYHVGLAYAWSPEFRSNLVWSQTMFSDSGHDLTDFVTADDEGEALFVPTERVDQAFVNTFWSFAKNAEVGLEYAYGRRETFDGRTGKQDRVTATFHYNFF